MSLSVDTQNIKDYEQLYPVEKREETHLHTTTIQIAFELMTLGFREITESNFAELYFRYCVFKSLVNFSPIPLQDWKNHVGLKINVATLDFEEWFQSKVFGDIMSAAKKVMQKDYQEAGMEMPVVEVLQPRRIEDYVVEDAVKIIEKELNRRDPIDAERTIRKLKTFLRGREWINEHQLELLEEQDSYEEDYY